MVERDEHIRGGGKKEEEGCNNIKSTAEEVVKGGNKGERGESRRMEIE